MPDFIFRAKIAHYQELLATETDARKIATLRKLLVRKKPSSPTGMRRTVSPEPAQPLSRSRSRTAPPTEGEPRAAPGNVSTLGAHSAAPSGATPRPSLSEHHDATQ